MNHQAAHFSILIAALLFLGACGAPPQTSQLIVAEEGGSVSLDGSTLQIPPAALEADTEVTMRLRSIAELPALDGAGELVLGIEPEGAALLIPATLTLDLDDGAVFAHRLVDGAWAQLESVVVSGLVETSITSLGTFAVSGEGGPASARIDGTLKWGDGSPVEGAPVELRQNGERVDEATTDAGGIFAFLAVAAGEYTLVVNYECELEEAISVAAAPLEVELALCSF